MRRLSLAEGDRQGDSAIEEGLAELSRREEIVSPEEERALSRPPSEPLRGEWHVDEGFASCRNIEERNRDAAGVFSMAEHPEFGEVTLFAYYPGLCANDDFRRLAVYEAKRREGRKVDGVPPLLNSGMERGLLYLLYEREAGERMADLAAAGYPETTPVAVLERLGSPAARAVTGMGAARRSNTGMPPRPSHRR